MALLTMSLTACVGGDDTEETPADDSAEEAEETEDEETEDAEEEVTHEPGEIPFDFPIVGTTAVAGQSVLAPDPETLEDAWEDSGMAVFIFYSAEMVEPGDAESKIVDYFGEEFMVPNSLIVPLGEDDSAEVGDVVSTWWQSGSGMMKAIVTAGGSEPTVRYLDDWAEDEDTLEAGSFNLLGDTLEPGVSVAADMDGYYDHAVVISVAEGKVLLSGFAGSILVVDESDVVVMPATVDVAVGDTVWAPVIGTYDTVTVTEVMADIGQIKGSYEWAGESAEEVFVFGEIAPEGALSE